MAETGYRVRVDVGGDWTMHALSSPRTCDADRDPAVVQQENESRMRWRVEQDESSHWMNSVTRYALAATERFAESRRRELNRTIHATRSASPRSFAASSYPSLSDWLCRGRVRWHIVAHFAAQEKAERDALAKEEAMQRETMVHLRFLADKAAEKNLCEEKRKRDKLYVTRMRGKLQHTLVSMAALRELITPRSGPLAATKKILSVDSLHERRVQLNSMVAARWGTERHRRAVAVLETQSSARRDACLCEEDNARRNLREQAQRVLGPLLAAANAEMQLRVSRQERAEQAREQRQNAQCMLRSHGWSSSAEESAVKVEDDESVIADLKRRARRVLDRGDLHAVHVQEACQGSFTLSNRVFLRGLRLLGEVAEEVSQEDRPATAPCALSEYVLQPAGDGPKQPSLAD
eukprot:TRINITY_DN28664_c0_g1_i1.p1 TRINITY_DN28664_c0_g1~~TRINITY_DN28664_c0_g1_i1.p1  ORF type:complete len:406 (+),score=85.05 TRINITY_DN28664_c0_g1_i1:72-1289(+)